MKKLDIVSTLVEGVGIGVKNAISLILTCFLGILSVLIPYLNIGVLIALYSLPVELSKGHIINPRFIFEKKYRSNMGEFFILMGLMIMAFIPAFLLCIVPGCVLSIAWSLAVLLFVDKGVSAMDALHLSNKLTYGNKWRIFAINLILTVTLCIISFFAKWIFCSVLGMHHSFNLILPLIIMILFFPIQLGCSSVIYRELTAHSFTATVTIDEEKE